MSERRRYYRTNDTVALRYQVLEGSSLEHKLHRTMNGQVEPSDLRNASQCIDARLETIARNLSRDNPLLAEALTLINRKFAILELMSGEHKPEQVMHWPEQDVNISGSGIAFSADRELTEETHLKLEIILYPENRFVPVLGRVVGCRPNPDNVDYRVAVDFESISSDDREHIIQHILKKQMEEIREHKVSPIKDASAA